MATDNIATLGIKVDPKGAIAGASRAKRAIRGIGKTANNIKSQIFSLNGALGALGASAVMKSVITSAASLESLRVRLKFLTGSTKDAGKAFDTMTKFASKVPFALEDIQKASPLLLTITDDIDELNGLLEMTGDIAAVSGLDFVKTAEQLQRAMASGIASADLFRERGVASFLGFEAGVTFSADETKKKLNEMWANGTTSAVGATKELADTFQGQVSMMEDAWFKLKIQLADTGIFLEVKDAVVGITKTLSRPETAAQVKAFGKELITLGKNIKGIVADFMALPPYIKEGGLILAIFGGIKGKAALLLLVTFGDTVTKLYNELGGLMGLVTRDKEEVIKDIRDVENAIGLMRAGLAGADSSLLDVIGLGDASAIKTMEGNLAELRAEYMKIVSLQDLGELLTPPAKKTQQEVFSTDPIPSQDVENDPTIGRFKQLISSNNKYIDSIKNVGIKLSDEEKQLQLYNLELERVNEFADKNKLSEEQRAEAIGNTATAYEAALERMAEADSPLTKFEESIEGIFGNGGSLASGIGDATAQMLVFGEKGSFTMKKLAQDIMATAVSALVQMGVQSAINWAKEAYFKATDVATTATATSTKTGIALAGITTVTAANVAAGIAATAAWTPAAIMASLASFGANSVPAMAGITATTTLGMASAQMASLPSAEGGGFTGNSPRSGGVDGKGGFLSILHPQETVIDHTQQGSGSSQAGGQTINEVNIEFTVNSMDSSSFQQQMVENADLIVGVIRSAFNEQGESVAI